jgi:hypothetical protein
MKHAYLAAGLACQQVVVLSGIAMAVSGSVRSSFDTLFPQHAEQGEMIMINKQRER